MILEFISEVKFICLYDLRRKKMKDIPEYDEAAAIKNRATEINAEWQELYKSVSSGQKAWLTQIKNYYTKMLKSNPQAVVELLAKKEFITDFMNKKS